MASEPALGRVGDAAGGVAVAVAVAVAVVVAMVRVLVVRCHGRDGARALRPGRGVPLCALLPREAVEPQQGRARGGHREDVRRSWGAAAVPAAGGGSLVPRHRARARRER